MDIASTLKQFDLNSSEITVYLWLLENGQSSPPIVSRETKIARTNCYHILDQLVLKGLAAKHLEGKRNDYLANPPEALLALLDQKKELARKLLPDLEGLYMLKKSKPKITYFDGLENVKKIYLQSLESGSILYAGLLDRLSNIDNNFQTMYLNEISKRNIALLNVNKPTPSDFIVWDDSVAFINLNDPAFGTLVVNKDIADGLRLLFGS